MSKNRLLPYYSRNYMLCYEARFSRNRRWRLRWNALNGLGKNLFYFCVGPSLSLWTFLGTRANRTIAKQIQSVIAVKRIDALGLDLTTVIDTKVLTTAFLAADPQFSIDEIRERSKSIKFADCLPDSFLARVILLRQFEQPASTS